MTQTGVGGPCNNFSQPTYLVQRAPVVVCPHAACRSASLQQHSDESSAAAVSSGMNGQITLAAGSRLAGVSPRPQKRLHGLHPPLLCRIMKRCVLRPCNERRAERHQEEGRGPGGAVSSEATSNRSMGRMHFYGHPPESCRSAPAARRARMALTWPLVAACTWVAPQYLLA